MGLEGVSDFLAAHGTLFFLLCRLVHPWYMPSFIVSFYAVFTDVTGDPALF